jgi:hypothetical protein
VTSQSKAGPTFLTVFGLPFLGAGLLFAVKSLQSANQSQTQRIAGALFGSVFAIIGGGLIFGAWFGYSKLQEQARVRSMNPDSPWLWRKDWAASRVESKNKARAIGWWVGAVLLNMASLPFSLSALPHILGAQDPAYFLPMGFELVGLLVLFGAIRATLRLERFGKTYFEMNSLPYSPGGHLSGAIHVQMSADAPHGIDLKLSCLRRITTGSGDNRSTQKVTLWEDSKNISSASLSRGPLDTIIPVDFALPADAFVTDTSNPSDQVAWVLGANADVPGVNYSDEFELPVFRTSSAWNSAVEAKVPVASAAFGGFAQTSTISTESNQEVAEPARHRVVVSDSADGLQFDFPAGRNAGRAALVVVLAAACTALIYAMAHTAQRPPTIIFIAIGLMDFILILASVHAALASTRIVVGNGTLSWRKAILGVGSTQTMQTASVDTILATTSIQQSSSSGSTLHSLILRTKDGKKRTLVDDIASRQEARWIVAQIEKRAGLTLNTQIEISNSIYGPPPQPGSSQAGAWPSRMSATRSGNWSHAVGALFFVGWVAFIGFIMLRTTRINSSRSRVAKAAAVRTAPRFVRTESMRHANLADLKTWPAQPQAEELLARAVAHDTNALQQLVQATPQWTSNIRRSDNLEQLETQARYSSDLRVRRAEADLELAADGWQKNTQAVDLLMQRAQTDASYRPAALYFLGILAGDGIETERSERFLVDYARNDPDASTRQWATEGLRFVGTDQALDELFGIFTQDASFAVRDRAGCNLADCGSFQRVQRLRMVPRLIDLVSAPRLNPQMKTWSFMALRAITGENLAQDGSAWRNWYASNGAAKRAEFAASPWWQVSGDN